MSRNSAFIEWNSRLILGISVIDKQHEKLVKLTNELHQSCLIGREDANRSFILAARNAANYAHSHLVTEERMMYFSKYPDFASHKREHDSFVLEVVYESKKFSKSGNLVPYRFFHFLRDWVLSHIAVNDKAAVEYILNIRNKQK